LTSSISVTYIDVKIGLKER